MKTKKPTVVRISRKKWSRGHEDNALLLGKSAEKWVNNKTAKRGNMCCLGFACLALGAKKKEIRDKGMPCSVPRHLEGLNIDWMCGRKDTDFSFRASAINDDPDINNTQREKRLRKLAKRHGFKFVFVP